jgi:hypothetical protein
MYNQIIKIDSFDKQSVKNFIKNARHTFPEFFFKILKKKLSIKTKKKLSKIEIKKIVSSIDIFSRTKNKKILYKQEKKITFFKDPLKILRIKKEVVKIDENLFQFQGDFLKNFRSLDKYFKNLALLRFNATEQENPIIWPLDLFKKINYFNEFPQQVLMITSLKKNSKIQEKFAQSYNVNNKYKKIKIDKSFDDIKYGLQPAVCNNCYYALKNINKFNNKIYTTYNKVFRNEYSSTKSLDRLMSFTVRDIMFLGDQIFVKKTINELFQELKDFFISSDLSFSIEVADDPFFSSQINKKVFQQSYELKYEILVYIPHLKKKIAVGSINNHLNTYGKALNIKNNKGFIHSGCVGIGFERLLFSIYSQYGNNLKKWPKKLLKILKYKIKKN